MESATPKISVIIPNFNRGDLLSETLDSILRQEYRDWEAIIVDDGSTDESEKVAEAFGQKDQRFRFHARDRKPNGAPTCRNTGIDLARGDYLLFLDSDDLLQPWALSTRARVAEQFPGLDFWVFPMLMFREDPSSAGMLWNVDDGRSDLYRFLVLDAPWQTSGPLWRKTAVQRIGGFTEGLACWQDVDFHLKALASGLKGRKFYDLPPDVLYRQHETNSVSQGEISSPAKIQSRKDIFIRHSLSLKKVRNTEITDGLRILGGNIAAGSARALRPLECREVIDFGLKEGIFSKRTSLTLKMLLFFHWSRLNRIPPINGMIINLTKKYRQDSGIGKHPYNRKNHDGHA